jgi:hypothetical protein
MDRKIIFKSLSIVIWFSPSYGPLGHMNDAYNHCSNPNFIMQTMFGIDKEILLLRWKLSRGFPSSWIENEFKSWKTQSCWNQTHFHTRWLMCGS